MVEEVIIMQDKTNVQDTRVFTLSSFIEYAIEFIQERDADFEFTRAELE